MDVHHHYADNATDHAPGSHPAIDCDGTEIWRTYGTAKGHIGPGTVFIGWGAWWTFWVLWTYLRGGAKRFKARPWYGPVVQGWRLPLEPLLKTVGPLIICYIELYGDHDEFRTLTCPDGRFAMTHMNNWQHASVYPMFFLAGLLDWAAMAVELPRGLQEVALGMAFGIEGFLMFNHKKHEPLDQSVHSLLVLAIWGCSAAIALEVARPRSVLAATGRGFFSLLQGAWLVQIAKIMWGGDPRWSMDYHGSAMMPPVYFVWITVTVVACMCACYVALAVVLPRLPGTAYSLLPLTQQEGDAGDGGFFGKLGPFRERDAGDCASEKADDVEFGKAGGGGGSFTGSLRPQGSMHMRSDSANESRPGSPRLESEQQQGTFSRVSPFSIASRSAPDDW